ncbi:MAG: argininosuccinate lyase [Pyrinomonadaceae bacterium]
MTERKNLLDENFTETAAAVFAEFSRSFQFDHRLFNAEIRVSIVYCDALFRAGVLTRAECERIKNGLQTILKRAEFNRDFFDDAARDVYSFIETRLVGLVGAAGEKLSVGRSRDEQTATALRLWLREEIERISKGAKDLQSALMVAGERQKEAVFPAFANHRKTHPVLWAHWCLAYFEMLARDRERLDETWRRVNILPLGAESNFEIDREEIARELGFEGVSANGLDAVADADYAAEFLAACSLLMIHLSRLAEDLILYASDKFNFVEFAKPLSAQNVSEVLELVRGRASRVFGHQSALLSMTNNLPTVIHRDLPEAIFDSVETVKTCLKISRFVMENLRVNEQKTREAVEEILNTNELADYLIQRETPPANAKETAEKIISYAASTNKKLSEANLKELRQFSEKIEADVFDALKLEQILASKNQIGGTAPERVFEALEAARASLERE